MKTKLLAATAAIALLAPPAWAEPAADTASRHERQQDQEGSCPGIAGDRNADRAQSTALACTIHRAVASGAALALAANPKTRAAAAAAVRRGAKQAAADLAAQGSQPGHAAQADSALKELARQVDIPYDSFTLANGLRVIVHTDRKAPVVALSVWYDVGSKHEPAGKTGFAHLFEHLMFNGSENSDDDYFVPLKAMGATSYNGTTWFDRTNYYETVPTGALEKALWLESDRMGYLLGAVSQEKLDNQRGVVQNEKRQGDNKPFGLTDYFTTRALYPASHPYGHSTIGSMADLDAASLADVHGWFKAHYGPNNAILALAGDIDTATAKRLVGKYFGGIKPGPRTAPVEVPVPTLAARKDETIKDRVSQVRIARIWAVPGVNDPDTIPLELGLSVFGGLASSRLDNQLVKEEQLATRVTAGVQSFAQGGQVEISADVKPGVDPAMVGARLDAIIANYIAKGPTAAEVHRAATQELSQYVKGLEAVGTKAQVLAEALLFSNDAGRYRKDLDAYARTSPARITAALQKWLSRPVYAQTVEPGARTPFPEAAAGAAAAKTAEVPVSVARQAREPAPPVADPSALAFPAVEHAALSNGIALVYAQRATVPMTLVSLSLDAGTAADPADKRGVAALAGALLDEGTTRLSGNAIAERKEELGAAISSSAGRDRSGLSLSALSTNLAPSLDLFADIALHPAFAATDVERVRGQMLASIAADKTNPGAIAGEALAAALYGADHPYGSPGKGSAASVAAISRDDLVAFHRACYRPETAKLFVVSDRPLAEIQPLLEARFGGWRGTGAAGRKALARVAQQTGPKILLIDRKDSPQSQISAGQLLAISGREDHLDLDGAAEVVGGGFLSRINMDLRETKGWSYGVRAGLGEREGQMTYQLSAPVQADQTGPAIAALIADYKAFLGGKGVSDEELVRVQNGATRELPGAFQTASAVMGALQENDLFARADDYYSQLPAKVRAQTAARLDAAARGTIDPARFTWVVVGDAAKVGPQLEALGLPVEVRTADAGASAP